MRHTNRSFLAAMLVLGSVCRAEFQVNVRTSNEQKNAAIAMEPGGRFVVVWSSYLQDGSSNGIYGRRFDPNCSPLAGEFQVNTTSSGNQTEPAVAMDAAAGFVAVWQGPGATEEDKEDIFARRFDPNGLPLGDEFLVNSLTLDRQIYPRVAVSDGGRFVIVWESVNVPEDGKRSVLAQLYDSSGAALGAEFMVSPESSNGRYPDVAADAIGNFAAAWLRDSSSNSIMVRLFDPNAVPVTEAFTVNDTRFSSVARPAIAMDAAGFFVVAWDGDPDLAGLDDIHARLYEPNGAPLGRQFIVNTATEGPQQNPLVAMNDAGEFVIAWESKVDPNVNERDIFGRRFDSLSEPIGGEFAVNTYIEGDQRNAAVAMRDDGNFVAVWQSYAQDGSGFGIFGETGPEAGSPPMDGVELIRCVIKAARTPGRTWNLLR
ncbi:MAG: hypothetical protein ABIF19_06000 [Planctomycetota bacterium]